MATLWGAAADSGAFSLLAQAKNTGLPPWMPVYFLIVIVVFFVMFSGADRKKRKEHQKLLANLKQNDHVVTIGGIHGTIVNTSHPEHVVIRVDENNNTKLKILRSAIATVKTEEKGTDIPKEK